MNLATKKTIDYYIGGLLLLILKPVVVLLGRVLRRDHSLKLRNNLYFIKMQGGGSLVIAFPALLGLRRRFSHIKFVLVTTKAVQPFAESLGVFDSILAVDDRSIGRLLLSVIPVYWACLKADTFVDLEVYSRLTGVMTLLSTARNRIGFYLESVAWRRNIYSHLIFYNRFSGSFHFYELIAHLLGAPVVSYDSCRRHFKEKLSPLGSPNFDFDRIAIGHACSELAKERMLSPQQWVRVFDLKLSKLRRPEIYFLGSLSDRAGASEIIKAVRQKYPYLPFHNMCGQGKLIDSLRLLCHMSEFWGIDSALLHYARLLGLRCVSFWGPSDPMTRLKPVPGLIEEVHYKKVACSPCVHVAEEPPCRGNNICMRRHFEEKIPGFTDLGVLPIVSPDIVVPAGLDEQTSLGTAETQPVRAVDASGRAVEQDNKGV